MAATRTRTQAEISVDAPRTDAYTGMLIVSLAATFIGIFFLFLDYNDYPAKAPNPASLKVLAPAPSSAPGPGVGGAANVPPMPPANQPAKPGEPTP